MHVTRHAVERFRERVLGGRGDVTDWDIEDMIRFTRHGRLYAYLIPKKPQEPAGVVECFLFAGEHEGVPFYVATNRAGDVAKTILTHAQVSRWTPAGMAVRLPASPRPAPVPVRWTWQLLEIS